MLYLNFVGYPESLTALHLWQWVRSERSELPLIGSKTAVRGCLYRRIFLVLKNKCIFKNGPGNA
jgi:hypothetical protein